mgnify:CR=1 FL=1
MFSSSHERAIRICLTAIAASSLLALAGIVIFLFTEGLPLFRHVSPLDFLLGDLWYPTEDPGLFGIFPLLVGSVAVTMLSSLLAVPLGVMTAVYLAEIAPPFARRVIKPFVELLAATAALGQERGLPSILVSNGFMSPGCLELLGPLVRAANIDLKAFSEDFYHHYCGARLRPVLDNLVRMRALGWWLEVTTLILEGLNDGEAELRALARFIRDELGADTPWHVTAFHPAYRMTDHPATRAETLRRCRDIGLEEGLRFVYTGNVFCAGGDDTLCPQCGAPCLERQGWQVIMRTDTGVCPRCGSKLPGVWEL